MLVTGPLLDNRPDERQIACGQVSSQVHLSCLNHVTLLASLRYPLKGRMSLYQEDDHQQLTTNLTIYMPSSDGCFLGFLPYKMGIAPVFHHIVEPHPLVPQTPSQAMAMHQHQ